MAGEGSADRDFRGLRISYLATMIISGSCRRIWRKPVAKVTRFRLDLHLGYAFKLVFHGSSMVIILLS